MATTQEWRRNPAAITVNGCQRGNPVLTHIRSVAWEYGEVVADFVVGKSSGVLYLSLKYHRLHPEYIYNRIEKLPKTYVLRVLLVMVDIEDHQEAIRELTKLTLASSVTMVLSWSVEEAGRYLETYKAYENKPPDAIMEKVDSDYISKLTDSLTQIRSVNKTDVITLASVFNSFDRIAQATTEELSHCPGFGDQKVRRLLNAFEQPFLPKPPSK